MVRERERVVVRRLPMPFQREFFWHGPVRCWCVVWCYTEVVPWSSSVFQAPASPCRREPSVIRNSKDGVCSWGHRRQCFGLQRSELRGILFFFLRNTPPVGVSLSGPTTVDLRRSARRETRLQHTHTTHPADTRHPHQVWPYRARAGVSDPNTCSHCRPAADCPSKSTNGTCATSFADCARDASSMGL